MEVALFILTAVIAMVIFAVGYVIGYQKGMTTMKRIDDRIIEEAKRRIYGEE